jgi:hypothetical protein
MDERSRALMRRALPRQAVFTLGLAALLFAAAGSVTYWQGWLFLVTFIGSSVALGLYFARHDPALIERRMKGGVAAEQEPAQKIIIALLMAGLLLCRRSTTAGTGPPCRPGWCCSPTPASLQASS